MKLTDEQSKIVEENHNLIYWYANMRDLDIEEWYGLLAIELCTAVMKHDPKRGSVSTFFKVLADNMVANEFEKNNRIKRTHGGHIEYDEVTDALYQLNDDDIFSHVNANVILENMINEDEKGIIQLRLEGYTQSEIAEICELSQGYVSQIIQNKRREFIDDGQAGKQNVGFNDDSSRLKRKKE